MYMHRHVLWSYECVPWDVTITWSMIWMWSMVLCGLWCIEYDHVYNRKLSMRVVMWIVFSHILITLNESMNEANENVTNESLSKGF